jgi:hypothetical protein
MLRDGSPFGGIDTFSDLALLRHLDRAEFMKPFLEPAQRDPLNTKRVLGKRKK